jgi:hypothetical protein
MKILITLCVALILSSVTISAETPKEVLSRYIGAWNLASDFTNYKGEVSQLKFERTAKWNASERFIRYEDRHSENGNEASFGVISYDKYAKQYMMWIFSPTDGTCLEFTGDWDAAAQAMTWNRRIGWGAESITETFDGEGSFTYSEEYFHYSEANNKHSYKGTAQPITKVDK